MKSILILILTMEAMTMAVEATPTALILHVAVDGKDTWSGTLAEANADGSDGPFATLERARDEIRRRKQDGSLPPGHIVVEIAGGQYERLEPFVLTAEDSVDAEHPILYRAREGERVVITGGRQVTNFQPVSDEQTLAGLSESARGQVFMADLRALGIEDFGPVKGGGLELFFNDEAMQVSRWPNEGFVRIADVAAELDVNVRGTRGTRTGRFVYEGDRPSRWLEEKDPWVHGYWFWDWSDQRHRVASINPEARIIEVEPPYHNYGYRKGQWFYAFNLLSEIDMPGEWYLDRETGILYFWPPGDLDTGHPYVTVGKRLLDLRGVSHVSFEGIVLEGVRETAVQIAGGIGNSIVQCTIRNVGGSAAHVSGGSGHSVRQCEIYGTGHGGISLSGGERTSLTPAGHRAEGNHIHHYARWTRMYQPAIALRGVGNVAAHNWIHDAPHMAISFSGNDHLIEFNEINDVCYESNDAGAIYAGRDWTMRGTQIRYNYLHDITGFEGRGCVGVYLDDMFCGTRIYANAFYRVTRAAFIGGGRDCTVESNVFVECRPALHIDARAMGWASGSVNTTMKQRLDAMPYKSDLWRERYPKLVDIWEDEPAAPKGNLVARNVCYDGRWDEVYAPAKPYVRFEENLIDEEPGFEGIPPTEIEVSEDSLAWRLAFSKIPFDHIGPQQPCGAPRE